EPTAGNFGSSGLSGFGSSSAPRPPETSTKPVNRATSAMNRPAIALSPLEFALVTIGKMMMQYSMTARAGRVNGWAAPRQQAVVLLAPGALQTRYNLLFRSALECNSPSCRMQSATANEWTHLLSPLLEDER